MLRNLIGNLRQSDSFNVLLFSGSSQMLSAAPVPATRQHRTRHRGDRPGARGGGSTEIVPALKRIAALPKAADVARSVIVVTDGYVTVENEVFALVRRNLGNSNVFAFGIGSSVNRHLIEGIARAGQGEPFIVTKPEFAAAQAERLRKMIDSPVLTGLQARFDGLEVYDLEPASLTALPDVLGGRPVVIQGKWRGEPRGQLVLEGRAAQGLHVDVVPVAAPDAQAGALRQLWARSRIQQLSDQEALEGGSGQREAITALGLRYSLLTQYTSFIAVDEIVRTSEAAVPVNQPLPLPQGVSNGPWVVTVARWARRCPARPSRARGCRCSVPALVGAALAKREQLVSSAVVRSTIARRPTIWRRPVAGPAGGCAVAARAWMAARVQDGSDAPLGLAALAALLMLLGLRLPHAAHRTAHRLAGGGRGAHAVPTPRCWSRRRWPARCSPRWRWSGTDGVAAHRRTRAALAGLVLLALPWIASLQYYGGYPLRVITAQASAWLLQLAGLAAERSGTGHAGAGGSW